MFKGYYSTIGDHKNLTRGLFETWEKWMKDNNLVQPKPGENWIWDKLIVNGSYTMYVSFFFFVDCKKKNCNSYIDHHFFFFFSKHIGGVSLIILKW